MSHSLRPKLALLLHTNPHESDESSAKVITLHRIAFTNGVPALDSGRLLATQEAAVLGQGLTKQFAAHRRLEQSDFLPETLLAETPSSMTWFRPPTRTRMHWLVTKEGEWLDAILPGLIFHVQDNVLCVAAYEGHARPNASTKVYHAPLGNVFDDTRVCIGNAQLPWRGGYESMEAWERVLLSTNFTHPNHHLVLRGGADTAQLIAFWRGRKRHKHPPAARFLAPLKLTAREWVRLLADSQETEE
jgi:PRTRC genetic system protein B